ncbi:hypothetical protein [Paracoccus mutanolyticus]|uniref:hypothetical protein n=1 Tax=Paracoccus mutanolyticus TaxID=1499308 RepID=UPI001CB9C2DB|nr:hypothetical protein [Paracoccus mutanolyticus]
MHAVDLAALNERGIALTIVGDVNSISVAEHAMMQLLAGAKRVLLAARGREPGQWGWRNLPQGASDGAAFAAMPVIAAVATLSGGTLGRSGARRGPDHRPAQPGSACAPPAAIPKDPRPAPKPSEQPLSASSAWKT